MVRDEMDRMVKRDDCTADGRVNIAAAERDGSMAALVAAGDAWAPAVRIMVVNRCSIAAQQDRSNEIVAR